MKKFLTISLVIIAIIVILMIPVSPAQPNGGCNEYNGVITCSPDSIPSTRLYSKILNSIFN